MDRKGVTSIRSTGSTTSWMSSESGFTTGASVMSEGSNQSFAIEVRKIFHCDTGTHTYKDTLLRLGNLKYYRPVQGNVEFPLFKDSELAYPGLYYVIR